MKKNNQYIITKYFKRENLDESIDIKFKAKMNDKKIIIYANKGQIMLQYICIKNIMDMG